MRPLSAELLRGGHVHWLDPRFNRLWALFKAQRYPFLVDHPRHPAAPAALDAALEEVHLLHFAGAAEEMEDVLARRDRPRPVPRPVPEPTRAPVVVFTFARPDTTKLVLDAIRLARPRRLLVVANAPRADVPGEAERCEVTRTLFDHVDWPCEVSLEAAAEHLPQTERIESGLDWAFGLTEEAIVLEDDCVPHPSFFRFCDELLEGHRDADRVMSISGDNFQFDGAASEDSYYLSRYPHTWGWATWARAWRRHDGAMSDWPALREAGWIEEVVDGDRAQAYWAHLFESNHRDRGAWDAAWLYSCWRHGGVHAIPNANLVTNIGFREDATHTHPEQRGLRSDLPAEEMAFPLRHPAGLEPNAAADAYTERVLHSGVIAEVFERLRADRRRRSAAAR
jgi:hypothetical protein